MDLRQYRGDAVLVTFIYTHCPDTCPLIVSRLRTVQVELGPKARDLRIVAVSTDPRGDTSKTVAAFLAKRGMARRMEYLIGSRPELGRVWKAWNIVARAAKSGRDLVEHSALIYGIAADGKIASLYPRGITGTNASALPTAVLSGHRVTLAELRGKPAFVNFWASWCDPCRQEAPEVERFDRSLHGRARVVGSTTPIRAARHAPLFDATAGASPCSAIRTGSPGRATSSPACRARSCSIAVGGSSRGCKDPRTSPASTARFASR